MPRNISFALTTPQFIAKTKTVTRRFGWSFLTNGTVLCGVEKAMGLKKGEQIKKLGLIEVVSIRSEPLNLITDEDVIKEGFPEWTANDFVEFLVRHYRIAPDKLVNRIEFKYLEVTP